MVTKKHRFSETGYGHLFGKLVSFKNHEQVCKSSGRGPIPKDLRLSSTRIQNLLSIRYAAISSRISQRRPPKWAHG